MEKVMRILPCLLILLCFKVCLAQRKSPDAQKNLIHSLREELRKAGFSDVPADMNEESNASGFHLELLKNKTEDKYRLSSKEPEAFFIKASNNAVSIKSFSQKGLNNGVYWYLHYLGYRYYFPNSNWHYVPKLKTPYKPIETIGDPSYSYRRIWYAYGTDSEVADINYRKWVTANLLGGEEVSAGHSYDAIVNRNKDIFLNHPEYFAQKVVKGKIPRNPKFEVGNEDLVQLVIQDAFEQVEAFQKKTGRLPNMISMDPSDGGGFSTSTDAKKIGGPSEQVFYLANRVAKALSQKYEGVYVGLYAYYQHAAPPQFELEPNMVVLIATAMNESKYRTDELIEVWKKKKVQLGIRDYYGVMAWDWDLPGQPKGGKISYVKQLKRYHDQGIRLFTAETNVGWISRGLGHYLAAQLLWNVETDEEQLQSEFFTNMFGPAAPEMKELFNMWQNYKQAVPLDGDLYKWAKLVEKASQRQTGQEVQKRLIQIKQYLHYVFLYKQWKKNSTEENLVQLLNYAYRIKDEGSVASYPLFRELASGRVKDKKYLRFDNPNAIWKDNKQPLGLQEIEWNFNSDMNSLNPLEETQVSELPKTFQAKRADERVDVLGNLKTSIPIRLRGVHYIVFQLNSNRQAAINIVNGLVKVRQYKTLRLTLYNYNERLNLETSKPVLRETISPQAKSQVISLDKLSPGIYVAVIDDARNGFTVSFTGDLTYGVVADPQKPIWTLNRNNLYFEVRKKSGFKIKNDGVMTLISPKARVIDLQKRKGLVEIQVEEGEAGIWQMKMQSGKFSLQDLDPLVSTSKEFLLRNEQ